MPNLAMSDISLSSPVLHSIHIRLSQIALAVLDVSPLADGSFVINRINVPVKYRGQGHGSAMLSQICEKADQLGVDLVLCINAYGDLTREDLEAWYRRYGFQPTSDDSGWYLRKCWRSRMFGSPTDLEQCASFSA